MPVNRFKNNVGSTEDYGKYERGTVLAREIVISLKKTLKTVAHLHRVVHI